MPIVTWRDEYNVNVKDIDLQHQQILDLVNNLHSAVEACVEKNAIKDALVKLVDYTRMHFSTEEKFMNDYAYPELTQHQTEHQILLQQMDDLVAAVSGEKLPTFCSDYDGSSDWALVHISAHDKKLGVFLNSKGVY